MCADLEEFNMNAANMTTFIPINAPVDIIDRCVALPNAFVFAPLSSLSSLSPLSRCLYLHTHTHTHTHVLSVSLLATND